MFEPDISCLINQFTTIVSLENWQAKFNTDERGWTRMKISLDKRTEKLTERIIGSGFEVLNELGHGFPEAIYQKALVHELGQDEISVEQQVPFQVRYKGVTVGSYYADIVVEERIIIELKTIEKLIPAHVGQVLNYLRASSLHVGLLLNFAKPKLEYRRALL
jgi:GxxExxY protein